MVPDRAFDEMFDSEIFDGEMFDGEIFNRVRSACAEVTARARHVRLNHDLIASYALALPLEELASPHFDPRYHYAGETEATVAYVLTLDAINFGSGYFPELNKRPGLSGYYTIASSLKDRFEERGAPSAKELGALTPLDCAGLFGQDLANEAQRELMGLFAEALNELGDYLQRDFGGSFTGPVEAAAGSAARLVRLLLDMPMFRDIASYHGLIVPFLKRAQITVTDLALALNNTGLSLFDDLDRLTIFADNLVPHVLRVDGILNYETELAERIARGEMIGAGSSEEVEIRALAVHTAELLVAALQDAGRAVSARELDYLLWNRGQAQRYKRQPRHRTRTVFY